VIWGKLGFFEVIFQGDVDFWGKNGAWWVNLLSLGKTGKKKTFENVQKRSKTFKNIQKYSNFEWKRSKIFNKLMVTGKWLNGEWEGALCPVSEDSRGKTQEHRSISIFDLICGFWFIG